MKILFTCFFFLISFQGFAQWDAEMETRFPEPKFHNSVLVTSTTRDTTGRKNYISEKEFYDHLGMNDLSLYFNRTRDTLEKFYTIYPGNLLEVNYWEFPKEMGDTATFIYNKDSLLQKEVWCWGEPQERDSSFYWYNKEKKLNKVTDIYNFGTFSDTFIYSQNLLRYRLELQPNYTKMFKDSTAYTYNHLDQLITIKEYDGNQNLLSVKTIKYNRKGLSNFKTEDYKYSFYSEDQRKRTQEIKYFRNGKRKRTIEKSYLNGVMISLVIKHYSKKGFVKKFRHKDFEKNEMTKTRSVLVDRKT